MTRAEAGEMLALLSSAFKVPVPGMHWSGRVKNGRYTRTGVIKTGPNCWRGTEASLVHEFAHHLVHHRRRGADGGWYGGLRWQRPHGASFVALLKAVAAAWYGDPARYAWETEYKSIRKVGVALLWPGGRPTEPGRIEALEQIAAGPREEKE